MTVSAFYTSLVKDIYSQPGYNLHLKQEQLLDNRPVIKLIYSFDSQEFSFRGMRLLLVNDNSGWIVTCISDPDFFQALEPLFDKICRSFSITESGISTTKPVINYFKTNTESINEGDSIMLNWDVSNATFVTILPMVSSVDLIGIKQLSPKQSTSFTLTAYNDFSRSSRTIDVGNS
jgi:hypothetical protein